MSDCLALSKRYAEKERKQRDQQQAPHESFVHTNYYFGRSLRGLEAKKIDAFVIVVDAKCKCTWNPARQLMAIIHKFHGESVSVVVIVEGDGARKYMRHSKADLTFQVNMDAERVPEIPLSKVIKLVSAKAAFFGIKAPTVEDALILRKGLGVQHTGCLAKLKKDVEEELFELNGYLPMEM